MELDHAQLDFADGVATVRLDRPDARNALSEGLAADLVRCFEEIERREARCVVLEGAGETFCAGGDIEAMIQGVEADVSPAERVELVTRSVNRAVRRVYECQLPTVAKLDGPAFGAGAGLAIACDMQLASPDASISFGFRRVGLAVDSGVSFLLPRLVGLNTAKELVYTGELLNADRARSLGLFSRVFEADSFEAGVANIVETIATGPTVALSTSKRLLNQQPDSFEAATANEAMGQAVALGSEDHAEGAAAFVEGREPDFTGE
jgi:enoyl-CoA hydratase/carnithine racemase